MERVPEPELMEDHRQARAYAEADFSEPHDRFVALFRECFPGVDLAGPVLDLGCGPADVSCRFALAHPRCTLHGVDGSAAMLAEGRRLVAARGLAGRITLHLLRLPSEGLPAGPFAAVISNSLLHHLADPAVLWRTIAALAAPAAPVFVMDLLRPASEREARALVAAHASGEPDILQRDFYHSLRAAYRPEELRGQLAAAGLDQFTVRVVSDRHLIVYGRLDGAG
ncbi:MAG TPA: class I SAM-dependent methyltransferase [Gammaproteobacteria bacterium]|nr:class I SAM-dependent methyltransferase [Gammaproteobacteria bacterium]